MNLDPDICERARQSRDARFDGRFFTGVITTGVYCRPVCPVRPPKRKNVRFFPTAAAAAEAGFRPCLRCRPECAPGTPAWLGTSATVSRGLRLIAAGALDRGSVETLATNLGMGARHLSRLFVAHVGASPVAVAQTRRLHFAKRLIDDTDLPMTQVALSAGFGSIRRFNTAFRTAYGRTPMALRRTARVMHGAGAVSASAGALTLRIPYRPPFDWRALLDFIGLRATPGVEMVDGDVYRRTMSLDGRAGTIQVRPVDGAHALTLAVTFPDPKALCGIVERVRRMFDLGADPAEVAAHLCRDAQLAPLVQANPGLRVPGAWDGCELAVRTILGQQVSVKGATTLAGRLVQRFGAALDGAPTTGLSRLFPTPHALAEADLASIGLPAARANAIRQLAIAVRDGHITFEPTVTAETLIGQLTALPGIGDWTAQYVAMRALSEPDAFPASDLALLRTAGNGAGTLTRGTLLERAEAWRPWRAYAAMYLWKRYADGITGATKQGRSRAGGRARSAATKGN